MATLPSDTSAPRSALRLTRRGRVLLLLLLVAMAFGVFSLGRVSGRASSAPDPAPAPLAAVVAQPGDTVWSIAAARHHGGDLRDEVARIVQVNHLGVRPLVAGQRVLLPR